jgi:hypothetical protein
MTDNSEIGKLMLKYSFEIFIIQKIIFVIVIAILYFRLYTKIIHRHLLYLLLLLLATIPL